MHLFQKGRARKRLLENANLVRLLLLIFAREIRISCHEHEPDFGADLTDFLSQILSVHSRHNHVCKEKMYRTLMISGNIQSGRSILGFQDRVAPQLSRIRMPTPEHLFHLLPKEWSHFRGEQRRDRVRGPCEMAGFAEQGRYISKVEPMPGTLSTQMNPPVCFTIP